MSRSRVTRNLTRLSGSSKPHAPTSPAWQPNSSEAQGSKKLSDKPLSPTASTRSKLLSDVRRYLSESDDLCMLKQTPLTDSRVIEIRMKIEAAMPHVYAMEDEVQSAPNLDLETLNKNAQSLETVRKHAEVFLEKFQDVDLEALRSSAMNERVPESPSLRSTSRSTSVLGSPEIVHHSKDSVHNEGMSGKDNSKQDDRCFDDATATNAKTDSSPITIEQKMVLEAIHDLFSVEDEVCDGDAPAYLTAPAAKSPEELIHYNSGVLPHAYTMN